MQKALQSFTSRFDRRRFVKMSLGVLLMGMSLSLLLEAGYGTDTSSFMLTSLSDRIHLSFGTTMVLFNLILIIPQILVLPGTLGLGTIFNMCLIGYISDFCRMLEHRFLDPALFTLQPSRTLIFLLGLIPFLIAVSMYMNADMGLAPFDAAPKIVCHLTSWPFSPVRMAWDWMMIALGILCGGHLTIGTAILAFTIGPAVTLVDRGIRALGRVLRKGKTAMDVGNP
ncbi:MAG: hypothetical protein IJ083_04005 [Clostridia bacterium]|nr:hypothetical protein [Clostridia bacterium]